MEGFVMTKQKIFLGLAVLFGAALAVIVHITQVKADGVVVLMTKTEADKVKCAEGNDVCRVTKKTKILVGEDGSFRKITEEFIEYGRSLGDQ